MFRRGPLLEVAAVLLVLLAVACRDDTDRHRKRSLVSPSGKYVLTVPIERNPGYYDADVWKVTIRTPEGEVVYEDDASEFVGNLKVHWAWDEQDRVWLYNSDDGRVWFWEQQGGRWRKVHWGYGADRRANERDVDPPPGLHPREGER